MSENAVVARLENVRLSYGKVVALDGVSLSVPAGCMVGLIGPDGVGKSSMLALISGVQAVQEGEVFVLGGSMRGKKHREDICERIAYMPQGLGKNLYPTLSVEENLQFFARLFGHGKTERRKRIDALTKSTGLYPFLDRAAGKLSGGMKQKLGLCCALIHDPDLLILDEPTTGVDPLARSQFWDLIDSVRKDRPAMSVMVATAYMDEAQRFEHLLAMDAGKILDEGSPEELLKKTETDSLEQAFIKLLPEERRKGYEEIKIPPLKSNGDDIAIKAENLTKKFGNFTAVDSVSFEIHAGEIFGFLGSNGCGKTTTMKMLTGLLPATEGKVWLFGKEVEADDIRTRERLGYMTQSFSLYGELTVRQNLVLHACLFRMPEETIPARVDELLERFKLTKSAGTLPENIPLGVRQRLSLAVAVIHEPEILILDEPTSGVDPIARDGFWKLLITLSREDKVTIFITTHFMNEAERCDRISLMHAGKVLDSDAPAKLVAKKGAPSLEEAFIDYLKEAVAAENDAESEYASPTENGEKPHLDTASPETGSGDTEGGRRKKRLPFSTRRFYSCMWRESLELYRDPIRATLALLGSLILMLVMGYGITMDVEDLTFAVLDRDQSGLSRSYTLGISGSRYFTEKPPIISYEDMDDRMVSGDISMAIEIPPGFGRDVQHGRPVSVGVWVDGAMPQRAETIQGYVKGMHQLWLAQEARERFGTSSESYANIEIRYRYNPDVKSLPAMVPAVIPLLLLMLPSMLAALAVVREKELGSIINLYTTPLTRTEFMIGKQVPYVALSMISFILMTLLAVTLFDVPVKGSFITLFIAALIYCVISTGIGLLASTFTKSQIAVMFMTMIGTMLPAIQFSGLLNTVSSLEGAGKFIGEIYPATHMLIITRGVFNKALGFMDLTDAIIAMSVAVPVILVTGILLLKKQAD